VTMHCWGFGDFWLVRAVCFVCVLFVTLWEFVRLVQFLVLLGTGAGESATGGVGLLGDFAVLCSVLSHGSSRDWVR